MNVFRTDPDPVICARVLCDKHVRKMPIEAAQMLATALRQHGLDLPGLYRATHVGHPCTRWAASSREAAAWLLQHGFALCDEYERRYHRSHATREQLRLLSNWLHVLPDSPVPAHPVCVDDALRHLPVEQAYRAHLRAKHLAWTAAGRPPTWQHPASPPAWALVG